MKRKTDDNHLKELRFILEEDGLPSPEFVDFQVTDSTVSPYSDKLIMQHASATLAYILTSFGFGLSRILRKDIIIKYTRLMADIYDYSKDNADFAD